MLMLKLQVSHLSRQRVLAVVEGGFVSLLMTSIIFGSPQLPHQCLFTH